ncbi:adenosine deaminase [Shewanella sp.]|uniref:adenosine deaminase n=1 Tax=Shewanella sp. TaxID=50422 RepID=UPI0040481C84
MKNELILALVGVTLAGCASIVNDKTDEITVTSTSDKSFTAVVDGKTFTVPGSVSIARDGEEKVITTSEPGCAPNTSVEKKMDNAFIGNVVTGGPFGSTTDYSTGQMWDYQSNVTIPCTK